MANTSTVNAGLTVATRTSGGVGGWLSAISASPPDQNGPATY